MVTSANTPCERHSLTTELSFTEPWVFDYPVSAGFDAFLTNTKKDSSNGYAYDEKRLGGDVRLGKNFNDNLSISSYYKLEQMRAN
jgi:outer membrane protein assembly factor BamA